MLTEKTFDTGTVKINYVEGPPQGRPLILIHGSTLRWQSFLPILPLFSFRYHTFAIDLRGHGLSSRVPSAYRFVDYAEDVVHFLRKNVDAPAVLLGHSLGAAVATQVAAEASDLTHALVLEEPANPVMSETWQPSESFCAMLRPIHELLMRKPSFEEIVSFAAGGNPQTAAPGQLAWAKALSQTDPGVLNEILNGRSTENFEAGQVLSRITCPVLLIQGNPTLGGMIEDWEVESATSRLEHCTHVHLKDVGHSVHTPQPVPFFQIVSNFLESL